MTATQNNVVPFSVFAEARALSLGMTQAQATSAALLADAAENPIADVVTENTPAPARETREDRKDRHAAEQVELLKAFPQLEPTCNNTLTDGAKNLRKELKAAFPGVKFSVRTSRFSMGDSIDTTWTDGPKTAEVQAITDRYQQSEYCPHEDYHGLTDDQFTKVFGGASYSHTSRNLSDAYKLELLAGFDDPQEALELYNRGSAHRGTEQGDAIVAAIAQG